MNLKSRQSITSLAATFILLALTACNGGGDKDNPDNFTGLKIKILVGSALGDFCTSAIAKFNATQPQLDNGTAFRATCETKGSGDVVTQLVSLSRQHKAGTLKADAPEFPSLVSLDGDIYYTQMLYEMNQLFPGQKYIPEITDSPLLASSPMVFMVQKDLAKGWRKTSDPYKALVSAKTHRDIDPSAPPLAIHYVHTAPTRSNSGLQTLVAQYASIAGKRPEQLTIADIQRDRSQILQIQSKITRYGVSTNSLAKAMVQNGSFWATVASVYESSVIAANSSLQPGQQHYEAVYPKATFTSNMRLIIPNAPWMSADEKAAAEKLSNYLRSPEIQTIASDLGLRPGTPGVALGVKFTPEYGIKAQINYDSLRSPQPEVVAAMLKSWQEVVKKPSLVVVVVDSSGSMKGNKLPAVQQTLQNYINNLGGKDRIALIDFDSEIRPPVLVDGTPAGRDRGIQFISSLTVSGGTKLYDSALYARNWLQQNLRPDAINAVLILTDGEDSESNISLNKLSEELKKSNFSSDERIGFFTVGYGKEGDFNPEALRKIADLNGGYYSKGEPETISRLMADLQVEF